MKQVLILAAVAIGGYLLYRKFKPKAPRRGDVVDDATLTISAYGG